MLVEKRMVSRLVERWDSLKLGCSYVSGSIYTALLDVLRAVLMLVSMWAGEKVAWK